jgi:hypothetical protein
VADRLAKMGAQPADFEFAPRGLTTWTVSGE